MTGAMQYFFLLCHKVSHIRLRLQNASGFSLWQTSQALWRRWPGTSVHRRVAPQEGIKIFV